MLARLPSVGHFSGPGLILVSASSGDSPPARIGSLTDAALRGRLAHFDQHPANEIAALRQTLGRDGGRFTVHETWSDFRSCVNFWYGFVGSQIRPVVWLCEGCGDEARESVGGTVGEIIAVVCACGRATQVKVPK